MINTIKKLGFIPSEDIMAVLDVSPDIIRDIRHSDLALTVPMQADFLGKYCLINGECYYHIDNVDYLKRVASRFFMDEDFRKQLEARETPYVVLEN